MELRVTRPRTRRAVLLLLVAAFGAAAAAVAPPDYTADGPCGWQRVNTAVLLPFDTGCKGTECLLKVIVTRPDPEMEGAEGQAECPVGPWPVVWMFSGFGSRAEWYSYLAHRLASYGYSVVQYNVLSVITPDSKELKFLAPLRRQLAAQAAPGQDGQLPGALDFGRQAVAGHSRGGKLAALHFAQDANITTAVLIDPVDNTMFSPESPLYPNAAKALAAMSPKRPAAVIGAGVTSLCNPAAANYATFYAQLPAGSWLALLPGANHADFTEPLEGALPLPPICGKGAATPKEVQQSSAVVATAWLEATFRNASAAGVQAWAAAQGSKQVELSVKA